MALLDAAPMQSPATNPMLKCHSDLLFCTLSAHPRTACLHTIAVSRVCTASRAQALAHGQCSGFDASSPASGPASVESLRVPGCRQRAQPVRVQSDHRGRGAEAEQRGARQGRAREARRRRRLLFGPPGCARPQQPPFHQVSIALLRAPVARISVASWSRELDDVALDLGRWLAGSTNVAPLLCCLMSAVERLRCGSVADSM